MGNQSDLVLFGGDAGWKSGDWTASDDRVRGGNSQSYLSIHNTMATFHGTLDITALGGAGFASQRTAGDSKTWNLSKYDGILLNIKKRDSKRYTLTLKDEILPLASDGREQSTISYEYDFSSSNKSELFIPWRELNATYRGREKDDAPPLNLKHVKRFSIMARSFFGAQEGEFSVEIESIKAISQSGDLEKGTMVERNGADEVGNKEPWSWKNSNAVGLAVILSSTWAICFGVCWWKGYDTSIMTLSNWMWWRKK
ncbi:CIA30 family protein [Dothidotthia symphoricarpi CBS 119687]|uniref:CIA30 family protein n=1 Tax=Dothidotthia symphoricarpi CBS 119687 TaxID=1392245 RepID=A0A6A6AHH9_9PLEO|nr:CIA30 family protein [Dothidotthia symphoricarpi CBS 119687]KAF2131409.1 CIA30 family protein [Dothidotthia symphoricarpi CBS 119687]